MLFDSIPRKVVYVTRGGETTSAWTLKWNELSQIDS